MKQFFLLTVFSVLLVAAAANPVYKEEARKLAADFYSTQTSVKVSGNEVSDAYTAVYLGDTTFYVFSFSRGGFVIISADDNSNPILGYSLTGIAQKDIRNTVILKRFEWYSKQVRQLKMLKSSDGINEAKWQTLRSGQMEKRISSVAPLLATTWNQSPVYNELCPGGTPSGCVATAVAQIMRYYQWPINGNGWYKYIPSTNPSLGVQYANFGETTYMWENMPNHVSLESLKAEKTAIATLMYHTGVSVNMDYDMDGSAASSLDVMYALTSYFKYDPSTINYYTFDINEESAWLERIKEELDAQRPVYYDGSSEADGGHAFVCDGYDNSDYLHINWGWGGAYNGYFLASAMTPSDQDFSEYNSIITGIKPGNAEQGMIWTKQSSGFVASSRGIRHISAISNRIAWAVGYDGSSSQAVVRDFTRTVDGGATWKFGTINASGSEGHESSMIAAVSDSIAWVALFDPSNGGGVIVKTTSGGTSWTAQPTASFSAPDGFPNVVHFWDKDIGFCQGDPNSGYFEIYTTANGGNTWTRVAKEDIPDNLEDEYGVIGYYDVYEDIIWFSTNMGRLYKSTDRGHSWAVFQTPLSESFEIAFRDENTGVIQSRGNDITTSWRTTNGGETWAQIIPAGNFYSSDLLYMPGTDTLISTGSDYATPLMGVSYSTDDGDTFKDYAGFYRNFQFLALGASPDGSVWAGGFNTTRYEDGMWHRGSLHITGDFTLNKSTGVINDSTFVVTGKAYGSPELWEWDFGAGAVPQTLTGKGNHTFKYTTAGYKNIKLTITRGEDQHIIIKKKAVNISEPTGVSDPVKDKNFILYPNPASVTLSLSGFDSGIVRIYNASGILVLQTQEIRQESLIDISDLPEGSYIVKVQTKEGVILTKKLIIAQ